MIGLDRPHHSATGFSQRLFSPSLTFMVICWFFVVMLVVAGAGFCLLMMRFSNTWMLDVMACLRALSGGCFWFVCRSLYLIHGGLFECSAYIRHTFPLYVVF
ncbi:hypothetical protein MtrunA17_Chr2g0327461 [Medicago truncatula]|uniref:Transmembrane protein n=1 Tax=Medicago truncatula TaxID=3880 RepID=A0A396JI30_MEDTR|nr:hypothetical protein MtrunA17_Chr2g0327461 [Medicago truncatula]